MKDKLAIGAIIASVLLFSLYHVVLVIAAYFPQYFSVPVSTNMENSVAWVLKHKEKSDPASVTLAIQTLRNSILVAVFVGGYAFQNGIASLSTFKTENLELDEKIATGIVSLLMFLSFLSWATVIRSAGHVGYHISVVSHLASLPPLTSPQMTGENEATFENLAEMREAEINKKMAYCNDMMARLMFYFSLGFRCMFVSIPFLFLSIGPIELLVATVVIAGFLSTWDFASSISLKSDYKLAKSI